MALHIEADARAIREARHWVAERLNEAGAPQQVVHLVTLGTSELVTNAVKYGPKHGTITVETIRTGNSFAVNVSDDSHNLPVLVPAGARRTGGFGMRLVQQIASHWEVEVHDGDGKTVSFSVPLSS